MFIYTDTVLIPFILVFLARFFLSFNVSEFNVDSVRDSGIVIHDSLL